MAYEDTENDRAAADDYSSTLWGTVRSDGPETPPDDWRQTHTRR